MVRAVVLDANALLMPFQFHLNLDLELRRVVGEVTILVPASVLGELARSSDRYARAAHQLGERYRIVPTELLGDQAIVALARAEDAAVVTNDRPLRRKLKREGIPVISLVGETHLGFERRGK